MAPSLLKFTEKKTRIHPVQLLDPSLVPAPLQRHKTALLFAWLWDWGLALIIAHGLITAWVEFIAHLVLPFVSPFTQDAFVGSAESLTWIVAALAHFTLSFCGLCADGRTFGMSVFKHVVSSEGESLSWQEAMLYAAGSTVSLVTAGASIFLLDKLVFTSTQTNDFHHWKFTQTAPPQESAPDLVADLASTATAEDFKQAA